jgi:hypothetical protein
VQRRGLGNHAEAFIIHPDQARDPPAAVGAEQILAVHHVLATRGGLPDQGAYALAVLFEIDEFVTEADPPG